MAGLDSASESFSVFLFLTGLGRCVGFVVNLDLLQSAAWMVCVLDPPHVSFWAGSGGHQRTPPGIVCSLSLSEGDLMFTLLLLCQSVLHQRVCYQALCFQWFLASLLCEFAALRAL